MPSSTIPEVLERPPHSASALILPSGAAKPSATSHDKINGIQLLQHMFSACKLSVYALQWLLPGIAQDSIINVSGKHFRCNHFQMPAILHFVAHRGFFARPPH
jgi:hypothetical protein